MNSKKEFELYNILEKDHWWFKARRNVLSVFLDLIENKEDKTMLEIGCGTGGNLKYLFGEFGFRIGVEYNDDAIYYSKNKMVYNTEIIKGDANNINLPNCYIDCIALLDVLYHKDIISVDNIIIQAKNILKQDGYLLISDGAFNFLAGRHNKSVNSQRRFTKDELIDKLIKADFKIVKASYWGLSMFFVLFLKRFFVENLLSKLDSTNNKISQYDLKKNYLNKIIYHILNYEKHIIARTNLPIGSSIIIIAKK